MNFANLSDLRKYISIAEHKPGTIKLKISFSAVSDPKVKEIIAEFKNQNLPKAVLDTKINIFTQTIAIKYDTALINPDDFAELLTTKNEDRFKQLAEQYYASLMG